MKTCWVVLSALVLGLGAGSAQACRGPYPTPATLGEVAASSPTLFVAEVVAVRKPDGQGYRAGVVELKVQRVLKGAVPKADITARIAGGSCAMPEMGIPMVFLAPEVGSLWAIAGSFDDKGVFSYALFGSYVLKSAYLRPVWELSRIEQAIRQDQ